VIPWAIVAWCVAVLCIVASIIVDGSRRDATDTAFALMVIGLALAVVGFLILAADSMLR
jgi:hypothetical protein